MKTRQEVVEHIHSGKLEEGKTDVTRQWHFGRIEMKRLLDYIYGGEPESEAEELLGIDQYQYNKRK